MKLFTLLTKPFVLFMLLLTLGIGEMWGTRLFQTGQKVYFQDATLTNTMSGDRWKSGTNGNVYAYFFNQKDHVGDDVTNWAEGAGKLVYGTDGAANAIYEFTVPSLPSGGDGVWWGVIFTRGTAASWDGRWNQTTNQYPADEKSLFTIADNKDGSNWTGNWSVMPEMLCSDITDPEWSKEDGLFFTEYSGEKGIVKINCTASQSFQFVVFDGTYYKSYADETNTTWADYGPKTDGGYNFQFQADEAGEYIFQWDKTNHKLWVWEPKARLTKQKYIYFDARNLKGSGTDYWQYSDFTARFWFKYYDSGSDKGSVDCAKASALEDWVYYALVPDDDYLGRIQMNKMNGESVACEAGLVYAKDRESLTQNCLKEESGKENWCTSWTPQWTTYCPPTTSETFADNSTETISWQPDTNDGSTSGKAIWVKTGTTLKVTANASKAVADPNMTIKYDFKVNSTSQQDGTTASYTHSASTNNTTYELSADIYTNYNLDNTKNSTKHTQSSIFYKALDTYSVTNTLSGVSKASGLEGDDAAAYYVAYDATYTANAGYYLPSDITVTIGGVAKTKGTDYTWTVTDGTSGALAILTDKIDGNVVVTINGIWRWSVAGSWLYYPETVNWDADTYAMGNITKDGDDDVCSVEITLPANTNYTFQVVDRSSSPYTWWGNSNDDSAPHYMTYGNSTNWGFDDDYEKACGITTAGAGTYTFTWNITDKQLTVTYPTSYYVTAATAGGGTVTPSSATYMSTSVGGEITATPNYAYYFNGWTSNAGGSFTNASAATTTFKPASADATVTAAFAERTAFIEANFQVYNSDRSVRTKTGNSWSDNSTAIKMNYDAGNNRYYLHTYSTPAELKEQLNNADAYFYIKTSSSTSSIANGVSYHASGADALQSLSAYGSSNKKATSTVYTANSFKFTGSEDGYVIIYFDGDYVWYELECALSYYGGEGATGDAPAERTYYAYDSDQTAAANTYSKTGYDFDHWDTAADDSGSDYAAGATNVAMNAREVCLHAQWTANPYTVTLDNREADIEDGTESVSVTYDATTGLTDAITKPEKLHYDFGGYYVSNDGGETLTNIQLIDANGNWNKGVSGYTGTSGDDATWVYAGNITLYAKWTEHEYAVTLVISPAGTGTTSPASSTTAKYVTASADITATPSTGYSFREWGFSKTDEKYDVYVSDDKTYSSTDATIKINAQHNGTLTANFTANGYTVNLENKGADKDHKGTENVSVTYNAITGLTSAIEKPEKAHYDFGGYYVSNDEGETLTNIQLIDASGNWNKGISGYTGTSGDYATWVYAGNITLYAKWTETAYTITPSVSPAGTGSVNTVTDAHWITPSSTITATPVNAAWVFDRWEYGEHVGPSTVSGNTVTVTSDMNSTITAHFKPRYELVGSKWNDSEDGGGMPGWTYDGTGEFTVNSFTALGTGEGTGVDLSYSCSLLANTTYNFQVHDRVTGNHGKYYASGQYINDGDHALLNQKDNNVPLAAVGAGTYTFRITNMTYDGTTDDYFPTITVERPHQLHFGTGYAGIDNLSSVTSGTTGGTLAVTTSAGSLSNEDWVTYGTDVTYTPSAATGYTFEGFYSNNEYSYRFTKDNPWVHYNVTGDDNVYAKFEEKSTSVTLANDGNGHVTIGGNTETSTTVGVTTTRELTAVPNDGYMFSSWSKSGDDITISDTGTNPTTLRGQGAGATSGQTVTANFTYRYAIKGTMNGENWDTDHLIANIGTNAGSKDTGYVEITLPANTTYEFAIYDKKTGVANPWLKNGTDKVYNMTYTNHTNWSFGTDKTHNCGITTAGKGTYKFIFNITDKTMTVTYPDSYQVNYGASVGGSVTSVKDDDNNDVPNGGYVRSGGNVTYTASANTGYTFVGWCNNDTYGDTFTDINPWTNSSVAATSNAYAKFISTNFVIYRTGDMAEDDRAALDDVESYAGGTISETIEFRMKVRELDKWYSLCLPFEVNAVKVWEDGTYYDLVPFYRPEVGSKTYYTGDYIIRTPKQTTDFPIAEFDDWRDPTSPTGYKPAKNTPYIIQWHDSYFAEEGGRYISFFGETGQEIPDAFSAGSAPVSDNVVNVCVNTSMQSGSVTGAYLLDPDYGGGAWLRNEDKSARTVLPFECFIRANDVTTTKYRVLRRDTGTNGATGFETVMPDANTNKVLINGQLFIIRDNKMYNVMGMEVQK